ncbi:MAG: TRAP transporter substrate-binding protein DctP [Gammaproteobacteria bacterium]|nr:TRAP transporter substrate-binding protein DctP [Gammaproteobacteria bacterium]
MNTSESGPLRSAAFMLVALLAAGPLSAQTTLKIATVTPEGSAWMRDMRAAAAEIGERTDGQVQVKFYGGGVMGDDLRVLRKIRVGQLQGAVLTSSALAGRYPDVLQYGLPLLFRSRDEMLFVRQRFDPVLADGLLDSGYETFGFGSLGFARIMSGKNPVVRLEDARGLKIWVPEGDDIGLSAMRSVGLAPVQLPISDVLVGLQTGLVEVIVTPPSGAILLQWHTRLRYVTDFPVVFAFGLLAMDRRAFGRLSEPHQAVVREVFGALAAQLDRRDAQENLEAGQALKNSGLEYLAPTSDEVLRWRRAFTRIYPELVREAGMSRGMHEEIVQALDDFRGGSGSG